MYSGITRGLSPCERGTAPRGQALFEHTDTNGYFLEENAWRFKINAYLCSVEAKMQERIMARPIKETPILYGEDARRFEARMKEHRHISSEKKAEMRAAYEAVKSVCDFI